MKSKSEEMTARLAILSSDSPAYRILSALRGPDADHPLAPHIKELTTARIRYQAGMRDGKLCIVLNDIPFPRSYLPATATDVDKLAEAIADEIWAETLLHETLIDSTPERCNAQDVFDAVGFHFLLHVLQALSGLQELGLLCVEPS